jgi:Glyoxalase-like domain
VIDCADPEPLARFWVGALAYEFESPPDGYGNSDD